MTREEAYNREKKLLEVITAYLQETGMDVEMKETEMGNTIICEYEDPAGIGEDVIGIFSFLPIAEGEEFLHHFNMTVVMQDDVPKMAEHMIHTALSKLNYALPFGAFTLNPEGDILGYRNNQGIPMQMDEEQAAEMMLYYITLSIEMVKAWMEILVNLIQGDLTISEFSKLFDIVFEEE